MVKNMFLGDLYVSLHYYWGTRHYPQEPCHWFEPSGLALPNE